MSNDADKISSCKSGETKSSRVTALIKRSFVSAVGKTVTGKNTVAANRVRSKRVMTHLTVHPFFALHTADIIFDRTVDV